MIRFDIAVGRLIQCRIMACFPMHYSAAKDNFTMIELRDEMSDRWGC